MAEIRVRARKLSNPVFAYIIVPTLCSYHDSVSMSFPPPPPGFRPPPPPGMAAPSAEASGSRLPVEGEKNQYIRGKFHARF